MKCVYVCFRLKNKSSFLICNLHWLITFYELDFCKQCRLYIVFNVCYYFIATNKKKRTTSKWFETCQTQSTKRHLYVSLVYCLFNLINFLFKQKVYQLIELFQTLVLCMGVCDSVGKNAKICLDLFSFILFI